MPHKIAGIEGYTSFITMVEENQEEYPQIIRIDNMKYSKNAFINALMKTNCYKECVKSESYI